MQLKTAILDQGEFVGGAERFMIDFLGSLNAADEKFVAPIVFGAQNAQYQMLLRQKSAHFKHVPFIYPQVRGGLFQKPKIIINLLCKAFKLKGLMRVQGIDQMVSNTPKTHFIAWVMKAVLGSKIRWIAVFHDFTVPPKITKWIGAQAETLVVNGVPTRTYLHQHLRPKDAGKIKIVENGVDLSHCTKLGPIYGVENVAIIGRLDPRKGQKFAIEAADLLLERNPDIHFHIVGSSHEQDPRTVEYEQEIKQFVQTRQLQNVHFIPATDNPWEVLKNTDMLLVLPTEPETFGRVVVEALALNRMVIAFDQTGPREIIDHFVTWLRQKKKVQPNRDDFLVDPNNAMSLAEKIGLYADKPETILGYTVFGCEFVQQNYELKETKKRLLNILAAYA